MVRVYWEKKIQDASKVRISPVNTGLLYGESLFESIPVYHGMAFGLKEHLERLEKGCAFLNWHMPKAREFKKAIQLFDKELGVDFLIRFNLTQEIHKTAGPKDFFTHAPVLYATARPLRHDPRDANVTVGKVGISPWQASGKLVFPNHFKAAVYMTTRKVFREHPEWADVLRLDDKGFVVDGGSSTPLWFDGRRICAAPLSLGGLESVTRIKVLNICRQIGMAVVEKAWKPEETLKKGELLMAGSGVGVMGISHINGQPLKSLRAVTDLLWQRYRTEVLKLGKT
jgi:branched-subunit amino acid aminotransferase/4-amino-4-deoxychorismate lyase